MNNSRVVFQSIVLIGLVIGFNQSGFAQRNANKTITVESVSQRIWGLALSPDGSKLFTGTGSGTDGTGTVWDLDTSEQILVKDGLRSGYPETKTDFTGAPNSAAFSTGGELVVVGGALGHIQVWNVSTGEVLFSQWYDLIPINSVGFHPNGLDVIAGDYNGNINIWEIATGNKLFSTKVINMVLRFSISPDGSRLLADRKLISIPDNVVLHKFSSGKHVLTPDGKYILEITKIQGDYFVRKFNVNTFVMEEKVLVSNVRAKYLFSPKGSYVIINKPIESSRAAQPPKLVDSSSGVDISALAPPFGEEESTAPYDSIVMSADESTLAASRGTTVYIWDVRGIKGGINPPGLYRN